MIWWFRWFPNDFHMRFLWCWCFLRYFLMCLNDFDDVHMSFQRLFYDCDDFLKIFRWFHMIWWFRWFPNDLHVILLWYWCSLHCLMCFKWFWWFPNDVLEKIEVILMIVDDFQKISNDFDDFQMIFIWDSYDFYADCASSGQLPCASFQPTANHNQPTLADLLLDLTTTGEKAKPPKPKPTLACSYFYSGPTFIVGPVVLPHLQCQVAMRFLLADCPPPAVRVRRASLASHA